jgi:hypothetical protein
MEWNAKFGFLFSGLCGCVVLVWCVRWATGIVKVWMQGMVREADLDK